MYDLRFHPGMTTVKWFRYPAFQQLLMIANEMNRAGKSIGSGYPEDAIHAWERAFELADLTIVDPKNVKLRRELLRFREMLGENFIRQDETVNAGLMNGMIALNPEAYRAMI